MSETTATQTEPTTPTQPPFVGAPPRRLTRVRDGKMLAGVSTGVARYLGVDPVVVRVGFALTTLFGGAGVLAYIACWVLMPQE
jgi:phage shock protein PspC (stress-responsive transcriptional regulator)